MAEVLISGFVAVADRFPADISSLCPWQAVGQLEALVRGALDRLLRPYSVVPRLGLVDQMASIAPQAR